MKSQTIRPSSSSAFSAHSLRCVLHAELAAEITEARLAEAEESNPEGWEAIACASSALTEPTFGLPLALLRQVEEVGDRDPHARQGEAELRADAELALALAERLRGRPDDAAAFLAFERLDPGWLVELPMALSSAGLVDEAVAIGDAIAELDKESSAMYANDVAVICAQAGRVEQALERVEANLGRFPDASTSCCGG